MLWVLFWGAERHVSGSEATGWPPTFVPRDAAEFGAGTFEVLVAGLSDSLVGRLLLPIRRTRSVVCSRNFFRAVGGRRI